jgi:hypothetical protein
MIQFIIRGLVLGQDIERPQSVEEIEYLEETARSESVERSRFPSRTIASHTPAAPPDLSLSSPPPAQPVAQPTGSAEHGRGIHSGWIGSVGEGQSRRGYSFRSALSSFAIRRISVRSRTISLHPCDKAYSGFA